MASFKSRLKKPFLCRVTTTAWPIQCKQRLPTCLMSLSLYPQTTLPKSMSRNLSIQSRKLRQLNPNQIKQLNQVTSPISRTRLSTNICQNLKKTQLTLKQIDLSWWEQTFPKPELCSSNFQNHYWSQMLSNSSLSQKLQKIWLILSLTWKCFLISIFKGLQKYQLSLLKCLNLTKQ